MSPRRPVLMCPGCGSASAPMVLIPRKRLICTECRHCGPPSGWTRGGPQPAHQTQLRSDPSREALGPSVWGARRRRPVPLGDD